MKQKMKVELEKPDGSTEVIQLNADDRDVRAYESEFSANFLTTDLSYVQISQLAWICARRTGKFKGSYDVWDQSAIEVNNRQDEDEKDEGEVDPKSRTKKAPTAT